MILGGLDISARARKDTLVDLGRSLTRVCKFIAI